MFKTITRLTVTAGLLIALPLGVAGTATALPVFDPGNISDPVISDPPPPPPPCKIKPICGGQIPDHVLDPVVVDPGPGTPPPADPGTPPPADPGTPPPADDPAPPAPGGNNGGGNNGGGTPVVVIDGQPVDVATLPVDATTGLPIDPTTGLPIDLTAQSGEKDSGGGIGLLHIAIGGAVIGGAVAGATAFFSRRRVQPNPVPGGYPYPNQDQYRY